MLFGKVGSENRGAAPMDPPLKREDPLFWLRDDSRKNEEVLDWLRVEARYLKEKTSSRLDQGAQAIYDEHISRLKETEATAPRPHGDWLYYSRNIKGKSYKLYCRRPRVKQITLETVPDEPDVDAEEQIILDVNALANGGSQCNIASFSVSPSHTRVAYTVDMKGNEVYQLRFLEFDSETKQWRPCTSDDGVSDVPLDGSVEWGKDDSVVFYVTRDKAQRSDCIWRRFFGKPESAEVIQQENDEQFSVGCQKTLEGNHLITISSSSETTECRILSLDSPSGALTIIRAREFGVRYDVAGVKEQTVFMVTNADSSINNKVIAVPLSDCSNEKFGKFADRTTIVAHKADVKIDDVLVFKDFVAMSGRSDGMAQVWTLNHDGSGVKKVDPPEPIYNIDIGSNAEYDAEVVRLIYSSPVTPLSHWDFSPVSREYNTVKQQTVPGYNSEEFICERKYATAPDGRQIPMSIVRRKDVALTENGPTPTLLYGYGSYGMSIDPSFSMGILPYTTRGMVYVIAHIRGGGEMGRAWYEKEGKYLMKHNTFQDFISCAEWLVDNKVTSPSLLAIEGRSAGGLLMGAVLNMRPDLFKAAVAGVPFVDVMTTMCDPSIPLTTGEWEEWGNPNEAKWHSYMLSYSPMDNIRPVAYPNILIVAGLHDPRVPFWEPLKWASKLREHTTSEENEILLKIDVDAGHFSASDRYKYWREKAFEQAFVLGHLFPKRTQETVWQSQ